MNNSDDFEYKSPSMAKRISIYVLSALIAVSPLHQYANAVQVQIEGFAGDFNAAARAGQDAGRQFYEAGVPSSVDIPNEAMLYPGTNPELSEKLNEYFTGDHTTYTDDLKNNSRNDEGVSDLGQARQGSIWADSQKDDPSTIEGSAYKVFTRTADFGRPDMINDPIFNKTNEIFGDLEDISKSFADCSYETNIFNNQTVIKNSKIESCSIVTDKSNSCDIEHLYDAAVITAADGYPNMMACDGTEEGCSDIWIGKVGNNYWSGNCTLFEEETVVKVVNPQAILSATVVRAKWDDYMQIWVGEEGKEEMVWTDRSHFPPDDGKWACELSTEWDKNPNVDVTRFFKNIDNNSEVRFKIRVSVGGKGEGYAKIRLRYDTSKAVIQDEWRTKDCIDAAIAVKDGFADGSVMCVDNPSDEQGCTWSSSGIKICSENLKPSPVPQVSNMCRKVRVEADYDFYKGELECYEDMLGNTQCPVNNGGNLNTCAALESNPQCSFISSDCLEGAKGTSGTCYVQEQSWDCGEEVVIDDERVTGEYQCAGEIKCMGSECIDVPQTIDQTDEYAKMAALSHVAQFMTQDMVCTGLDADGNATGLENIDCKVFAGEDSECKIAVGGEINCCKNPLKGVSLKDYLRMIKGSFPRLEQAAKGMLENERIQDSGYNLIKSVGDDLTDPTVLVSTSATMSMVAIPLVNYADNATGNSTKAAFKFVGVTVEETGKILMDQATEVFQNLMGLAASPIGQAAATELARRQAKEFMEKKVQDEALSQGAATALGAVMAAYTAYVVAMAVLQAVFNCESDEIALAAKEEIEACHHVGTYCKTEVDVGFDKVCIEKRRAYCCFNSPLSRIVQEGARPQLGMTWGTAKNPVCGGIPFDRIQEIDWSRVDLDSWVDLLKVNDALPKPSEFNLESVTGDGSPFKPLGDDATRDNIIERTEKRLEGSDIHGTNKAIGDSIIINPSGGI